MPEKITTIDPHTFGCARCDNRWTGMRTCHCGGCHETFSGLESFDRHRFNGACRTPDTDPGLEDAGRAYRCWRLIIDSDAA